MANKEYIETAKYIIEHGGSCSFSICNEKKCPINKKPVANCEMTVSSYFKIDFSNFVKLRGDKCCEYYKKYFEDWLKKNKDKQLELEF